MEINDKNIKRITIILIIAILAILVFLIIRPIIISIIGGLLLAYVFMPVYKKVKILFRNPTLSASVVAFLISAVILVPAWFLIPTVAEQVFNFFSTSQGIDASKFIIAMFPHAPEQFVTQVSLALNTIISKASSTILESLLALFLDIPTMALHFMIVAFIFFFTLRDYEYLKNFVAGISPFNKSREKIIVKQFQDITDSIIYGNVIVGIVQGLMAGLGFLVLGLKGALLLTIVAVFLSLIPMLGPAFVWIPVTIYLFAYSNPTVATIYFLYNLLIVSTIDNVIRSYLISRKSDISQGIVVVGIVGGIIIFGIMGLIIGPLIVGYFITLLRAYKERTLYDLFEN